MNKQTFTQVMVGDAEFLVSPETGTVRQVLERKDGMVKVRTLPDGALAKRVLELASNKKEPRP